MPDNSPVLVAVGQQTFRDRDPARTPVDAMEAAARLALADAGNVRLAEAIDTVVTVPFIGTQVPDIAALMPTNTAALLADRLGLQARLFSADVGGSLPQLFVNRFADQLAAGECRAVMICGSELLATMFDALRGGKDISGWTIAGQRAPEMLSEGTDMSYATERAHGLFEPINTYPLFESALRHHKNLDSDTHNARIAGIVSRMSEVAAANPHAWRPRQVSVEEALSTENGNRMIVYPYTKVMNSILAVDMAAAVIMTTEAHARALGFDAAQMIYLRGGAEAHDVDYVSERVDFFSSPALQRIGPQALAMAGMDVGEIDLFDIYSCFPAAVQIACDALGLEVDDPRGLTVTGGLTLFGGPGNNYSLHAIAEMVSRLRERGGNGLVTANGGYITKHAVGVYSSVAPESGWDSSRRTSVQAELDAQPHPVLDTAPRGRGVVEGHALRFEQGEPSGALIVGRLDNGKRFVAHTRKDPELLESLVGADAVGRVGRVSPGDDKNLFEFE